MIHVSDLLKPYKYIRSHIFNLGYFCFPMPYFYHIDRTVDVIFVRHIGRVSSADLCAQLEEILLHADFTSGLNMFFDHRDEVPPEFNVDKDTIPPGERDIYRSRLRSLFGSFKQSKMACLVNENLLEFFDDLLNVLL